MRRVLLDGLILAATFLALALLPRLLATPAAVPAVTQDVVEPSPPVPVTLSDLEVLRRRALALPVEGLDLRRLRDNFAEARLGHEHQALDILAPRGTRVLAVDDGVVVRLYNSVRGGLTVYQFDQGRDYCYYYAHLDGYAGGIAEGSSVHKGDTLGYVGTTGNAPPNAPHLHFTIFKLGPEKRWWQGTPINPFPLWATPVALP